MSNPIYQASYTGQQVEDAIRKALPLEDFSYVSDEIVNGKKFHVLWKVAPTVTNTVSGISIHPDNGQICEVISEAGSGSATLVKTYARIEDIAAITNDAIDALWAEK